MNYWKFVKTSAIKYLHYTIDKYNTMGAYYLEYRYGYKMDEVLVKQMPEVPKN